ncbi:20384_t:CDS:1, partial [Rhizophagus irregularis]
NISQLNQEWIFVPSKTNEHAIQLVQHSNQFANIGNNGFIIASTKQLEWIFEEK